MTWVLGGILKFEGSVCQEFAKFVYWIENEYSIQYFNM